MPTNVHKVKTYGKKKKPKNWLKDQTHVKIYNSARWRNLRKSYIQRHPVCEMEDCTRPSYYVDHIKSISDGGAIWDEGNFQGLCVSCNASKTAKQKSK